MTRRFDCKYALGSTTGAGGIGAADPPLTAGAATGAALLQELQLDTSQPQVGAAPHPQESQPLSQQLDFFLKSLANRPPHFLLDPQQLSQEAISQPQVGAAPQGSQELISHPQVGAQELISHPQVGAPHGSQPVSQQLFLHDILPFSLAKSSRRGLRRGLQQPVSQQEDISQPQEGAAPQGSQELISHPQVGAQELISQPQVGSAEQPPQAFTSHPQVGSAVQPPQALISHPQVGSAEHPVSQHTLSQPLPFRPSMRSNNPPAKL